MTLTLTLGDIGLFILFCAVLALIIFIVITLKKINRTLDTINAIANENKTNIQLTLKDLPVLIENTNDVMLTTKDGIDKVKSTVEEWDEVLTDTVTSAGDKLDSLGIYMNTAADIVKIIVEFISGLGKKK